MKKISFLAITILLAITASAQGGKTLADLVLSGESGETYMITEKLLGVYVPVNHTNVIFVKDENNYSGKSQPTEDQYNNGKLYDERDGTMSDDNIWTGTFDQSNWLKVVFPAGADATQFLGTYFGENSIIGKVNVQNAPCNPLGITITVSQDDYEWIETAGTANYELNTYCTANFVLQRDWYLVKPQNQEVAMIHWAVYNKADKKFYVPKKDVSKGWNMANLSGSFAIDMSLYEPSPGIDPDQVFTDGTAYDFKALIEYRTGTDFSLNIDPGFGGENNYHFAPAHSAPEGEEYMNSTNSTYSDDTNKPNERHRAYAPNVAIGDGGEPPYLLDNDNVRYDFTVIVYPLELDHPDIITGVEHNVGEPTVQSVRYCDLQGRMSTTPHSGINIVVTTMSDGTVKTTKMNY